jgi:hypothetical protein
MKLRLVMAVALATGMVLLFVRRLPAQGPGTELSQAVRSYQNLDFEATADLTRRALNRPGLDRDEQTQALSYLGASEFFLGHRDAALAAFRQIVSLDPRDRPDPLVFPPEVQRVYDEARRAVKTIQAQVPSQADLRIGETALPFRLFASSYQDVGVGIASRSGGTLHWIYTGPIADSVDLVWDGMDAGGSPLPTGSYLLRIATRSSSGRVLRTLDIPMDVTLERQDTLPWPRPINPAQFKPEYSKAGLVSAAARGAALGIAVLALPAIVGADSISPGAPILVGAAIGISGAVELLSHPNGKAIDANIAYNRQLREDWKAQADSVAQQNARRRQDIRLAIRTGEPVVRETGNQ